MQLGYHEVVMRQPITQIRIAVNLVIVFTPD